MTKGIIYAMTTVVPGLIKIGKTGSNNFEQRMYNLEHNGYFNVVGLHRRFAIEVEDYDEKEALLDEIFSKSRVPDSELFALDIDLVIQLLSSLRGIKFPPRKSQKRRRSTPQLKPVPARKTGLVSPREHTTLSEKAARARLRKLRWNMPGANLSLKQERMFSVFRKADGCPRQDAMQIFKTAFSCKMSPAPPPQRLRMLYLATLQTGGTSGIPKTERSWKRSALNNRAI